MLAGKAASRQGPVAACCVVDMVPSRSCDIPGYVREYGPCAYRALA
jgi:hypothetical protein